MSRSEVSRYRDPKVFSLRHSRETSVRSVLGQARSRNSPRKNRFQFCPRMFNQEEERAASGPAARRIRGFRVYRRRCLPWLSRFLRQNYPAEGISSWSGYWCPADDCFSPGTCRSRRKVCRSSPPSPRRGTPRKPSLNATYVTTKLTQRRDFYSDYEDLL